MVIWSGPAKKHLKQIYDYIAQDSKYYAKNVARNIVDKSETLKAFPEKVNGTRQIMIKKNAPDPFFSFRSDIKYSQY